MTKAIYRAREDGDWDFVAAFNEDELPDAPSNWPEEICVWFGSIGESCIVVRAELEWLTDVLDGDSLLAMDAEAQSGGFPAPPAHAGAQGEALGGRGERAVGNGID